MGKLFGTDGVRGIVGKDLTVELAYKLGKASLSVLVDNDVRKPRVLIGRDSRISGNILEDALAAGIMEMGGTVINLGVVPTPAVAYLAKITGADIGVVISASHNPFEYNGIKFFNKDGYKISDLQEMQIEKHLEEEVEFKVRDSFASYGERLKADFLTNRYVSFLKELFCYNKQNIKIVVDCANGAASKITTEVFDYDGIEAIYINNNPNGTNINENCGSTNPEELKKQVLANNADLGIAFDGDADRLIAVDEKGNIVDGDFILAICARHLKKNNRLSNNIVVSTIMSNMGLDLSLSEEGIGIAKSKVGDKFVLEKMKSTGSVLGGEQSGHIIFLEHNTTGDGILSAVQLISAIKDSGKSLSELAKVMSPLPQVLINVKVPNDKKKTLETDETICKAIEKANKILDNKGRVLVRPSGTEPVVRIMVEGEDKEIISKLAEEIKNLIEIQIN